MPVLTVSSVTLADRCSVVFGARASRPLLDKLLDHPWDGDEVVVWKLDRLGRNSGILLTLIPALEHRDVHFRSAAEGISTTGPIGKVILTVIFAFGQLERDQLSERTSHRSLCSSPAGLRPKSPGHRPCRRREDHLGQPRHRLLLPEHRKQRSALTMTAASTVEEC